MARTTLKSYFLPHQSNSLAAKAHHHSAWVAVAGVSRTEMREHLDSHYCLASTKLIPSVYLMITPSESNDELQTGRLAIFSHMQDLESLLSNSQYDYVLKTDETIRPIWILLVDGGPDENPRHLKNIKIYCQLFKKFDLDFLSIRTHAPDQSKYNPVERGMATLSGKLAGITLPIDHFGTHLDSQGKVIDAELAIQNFRYSGEALCELWRRD
ncbi:uncharacterized protein LOC112905893 [Rhizophagus irregularis DAOM 181602=DAOM 197198]|nr:uncharacterized protein LOC112905893 [Rhizophagus irregularis DAOM 181602=DAOM 197198]